MKNAYVHFFSNQFTSALKFYGLELKCLLLLPLAYLAKIILSAGATKRDIWLVGENIGDCLKDNGYCFFKYCQQINGSTEIYFITHNSSLKRDRFLSTCKNVLIYGSLKHVTYLFLARVFIYSHTHRDILYHKLFPLVSKNKKMVFLQHGVTGFKKFDAFYQKHCNEPDILIVVSGFEKSIIANQVGTDEKKIKITGFARYDSLQHSAALDRRRQIAYLPTWRDWVDSYNFTDSRFFQNISAIINSDTLASLLRINNINFKLYLHKNMKQFLAFFQSKHPNIVPIQFGHESVQSMLKSSDLLITDYSSVSWDFYYLDKPVIFYQFDLEDYLNFRGSYLDVKKDLFGDRSDTLEALIGLIEDHINNGFQVKEMYRAARSKYFNFSDRFNCRRIYQEIDRMMVK